MLLLTAMGLAPPRRSLLALLLTSATLLHAATANNLHARSPFPSHENIVRRQDPNQNGNNPQGQAPTTAQQQAVVDLSNTNPVQAAQMALQLPGLLNVGNGNYRADTWIPSASTGGEQLPWNNATAPFLPNADASNDPATGGWKALPTGFTNFVLNRSLVIDEEAGATMPFYVNSNYDPKQIQKTIIVWPGKPRDSWAYTNYINNALNLIEVGGQHPDINHQSVLIIGPAWMNEEDQAAGAPNPKDLVFGRSQWTHGGVSKSPNMTHSITSYAVMDTFLDMVFDNQTFPNMKGAVIVGHSMGAQATQRYALMKKTRAYDNNVKFWVGNPGSYAWLVQTRPNTNPSCADPDTWHYGIHGNQTEVTKYARDDVVANTSYIVDRYLQRKVHLALGLLDNGAGDTHCQAALQGGSHLERGARFVQMLGAMPGGFPASHTVDFIARTSHQDYAMISSNVSLNRIFLDDWGVQFPLVANTTNPGDPPPRATESPPPKAFATPQHLVMATALLWGSVGACVIAFFCLPFLFPARSFSPEEEYFGPDKKFRN